MKIGTDFQAAAVIAGEFLAKHPIADGKLKKQYRIERSVRKSLTDPDKLKALQIPVEPKPGKKRRPPFNATTRASIIRFAGDVQQRPDDVLKLLARQRGRSAVLTPDIEALLRATHLLALSNDPQTAAGPATLAFTAAASLGSEEALRVLPRTLYYVHRCGAETALARVVRRDVLPAIRGFGRRKISALYAGAAIAQLSCALNEGGRHAMASELFQMASVRALRSHEGELAWCARSAAGNYECCRVLGDGLVEPALDVLEDSHRRAPARSNQRGLSNTIARMYLARGLAPAAWAAIGPEHTEARMILEGPSSVTDAPSLNDRVTASGSLFHHIYETQLLGTLARATLMADKYTVDDLERDVTLLETLLVESAASDGDSPLKLGYAERMPFPQSDGSQMRRLAAVCNKSIRSRLSNADAESIASLAKALLALL